METSLWHKTWKSDIKSEWWANGRNGCKEIRSWCEFDTPCDVEQAELPFKDEETIKSLKSLCKRILEQHKSCGKAWFDEKGLYWIGGKAKRATNYAKEGKIYLTDHVWELKNLNGLRIYAEAL